MKFCNKCKVNVAGSRGKCPLCQNELDVLDAHGNIEKFPPIKKRRSKVDIMWRIFLMVSILAIFICFIVNYQFPQHVFWCKFVAGGVFTSWILLFVLMKKYKNVLKCLFYETIVVSFFVVGWDYYTGMHGWSLDFVLPILFILVTVAMGSLAKVLRIGAEEHIVYFLSLATFGIIPGVLWLNNVVNFELPSLICIGISLTLIFTLVLFEGKKMIQEFSRRLHM